MQYMSLVQRALRGMVIALCLGAGLAMAQAEPTLNEVYATAQAGKIDQAQVMMQQVLVSHPGSAKAYFVQSELFARQGNRARAQESLAKAEQLAPGLPFAKPEAVRSLRAQLALSSAVVANPAQKYAVAPAIQQTASANWLLPALLAGLVLVVGYFLFRRRPPVTPLQPAGYSSGLNGPQLFGSGAGTSPTYGPTPYGQPAGSGLGGKILGGVATGLAVGAGVMAAEAIGRNLMGERHSTLSPDSLSGDGYQPMAGNTDMGGQDFGVTDGNAWDDGGSMDGGSNDWDN
ncbi:hypothetical protein [Rhodoferax saidenbachensis]|uniref:Tetratricopeptide repeat protein n=1 Tax=Rhodoferax saidenbachensis TaxID=1484693 RepID=A0ABU1ZJV9_9BURK|nr:hypothetical protein [Rhodoferax saidenbachensis]MDR7305833.1 hypothetical protein [Rhodoferax saidenbachensis]